MIGLERELQVFFFFCLSTWSRFTYFFNLDWNWHNKLGTRHLFFFFSFVCLKLQTIDRSEKETKNPPLSSETRSFSFLFFYFRFFIFIFRDQKKKKKKNRVV